MKQLLAGALFVALFHITPTVILVKRTEAVKQLLPDAEQFFMRDVHLSKGDADRLSKDAAGWSAPDDEVTFYIGKAEGKPVGVIEFIRVDTPHGPIEVAVGFDDHETVHRVIVTKATTETKPWVLEALGAGLTDSYRGMKTTDMPHGTESIKGKVGDPALFITNLIDQGVFRALVAYRDFYASSGNLSTRTN